MTVDTFQKLRLEVVLSGALLTSLLLHNYLVVCQPDSSALETLGGRL